MTNNLRRLFAVLDRWKWHYFSAGLLMILAIALQSIEPRIIQVTVDYVITHFQNGESAVAIAQKDAVMRIFEQLLPALERENLPVILMMMGAVLLLLAVFRGGFSYIAQLMMADSTEKAIKHLRDRLFSHVQKLPMAYFTTMPKGDLLQRSTGDIQTVRGFIHSHIVEVMRTIALFGFSFAMMASINLEYALMSTALAPILIISSYVFFKKERKNWEMVQVEADKLDTVVQENLNGIRTVQAFANENHEIAKFAERNQSKLSADLQHLKLHTFFWPASDFVVGCQITITVLAGGYLAMNGQITVGEMLSFYAYATMLSFPMRQFGKILSKIGVATVAIGRIHEVLDSPLERQDGFARNEQLRGMIEFRDVSFRFDKNARENILKRISFSIQPGEKVALVGATGSGKSTIIKLLVGLYDPDSGQVNIDGHPVEYYSPRYLRQRIGFVLQSPFLFSTTVKHNIAYADPDASKAKIWASAQLAKADQLESVLPDGYETMVGEKGVTLSGGQKQRVALARTLLTEPDILVLDDVTSAVDTETEQAIFEALQKEQMRKTTIIISHRVTTIQQADRVLVIHHGRIVQEGKPDELANIPGYYRDIHLIQNALEAEIQENIAVSPN